MALAFYSYLWLREDLTPYYAGKGCRGRAYAHDHSCINRPADKWRILVFPQPSESAAHEHEKFMVAIYGRKDNGTGILRNLSDGGEGLVGYRHTVASREKMRGNKNFRGPHSEETKKKMSESQKRVGNVPPSRKGKRKANGN